MVDSHFDKGVCHLFRFGTLGENLEANILEGFDRISEYPAHLLVSETGPNEFLVDLYDLERQERDVIDI